MTIFSKLEPINSNTRRAAGCCCCAREAWRGDGGCDGVRRGAEERARGRGGSARGREGERKERYMGEADSWRERNGRGLGGCCCGRGGKSVARWRRRRRRRRTHRDRQREDRDAAHHHEDGEDLSGDRDGVAVAVADGRHRRERPPEAARDRAEAERLRAWGDAGGCRGCMGRGHTTVRGRGQEGRQQHHPKEAGGVVAVVGEGRGHEAPRMVGRTHGKGVEGWRG